jgi:hypothetical protein
MPPVVPAVPVLPAQLTAENALEFIEEFVDGEKCDDDAYQELLRNAEKYFEEEIAYKIM